MILSREEKLKLFSKLPSDLQEMIFSDITVGIIDKICKKYNLSEEKSAILVSLISDVLFGITIPEQLPTILKQKLEIDEQTAANLNVDLTTELFSKIKTSLQKIRPSAPIIQPTAPQTQPTAPSKPASAPLPTPVPGAPISKTDQYREPIKEVPEIIDLRTTPPSPASAGYGGQRPPVAREGGLPPGLPIAAAPIPPLPIRSFSEGGPPPLKPLTFTKPIEKAIELPKPIPAPIPLIEAEPHKMPSPIPTPKVEAPMPPKTEEPRPPLVNKVEPQYIIRPPGLAPTDLPAQAGLPHDILDLRKDKGEF